MADDIDTHSVGLVTPKTYNFSGTFAFELGRQLDAFDLVVETYGQLNADASNAVLVCHALSGHHHAAGYHSNADRRPGWWDNCIGPGKPIDTDYFFVVSLNNLGGCHGSTGPNQINPQTNRHWGSDFPQVTVKDWVHSQVLLADRLKIQCWAAVIGGSLGGMQAMQWAVDYPQRVANAVLIATAPKLSAQNIAFNEIARHAILSDPNYQDGHYADADKSPEAGLALARMVGHITYQSDDGMGFRFGRKLQQPATTTPDATAGEAGEPAQFQIESYLQHQGSAFSKTFDANTYLFMTRALDYFNPAAAHGDDLAALLASASCRFLVLSFSSDWRFSPRRSEEIVDALLRSDKRVSYVAVEDQNGHDAFLLPNETYHLMLRTFLARIVTELPDVKT